MNEQVSMTRHADSLIALFAAVGLVGAFAIGCTHATDGERHSDSTEQAAREDDSSWTTDAPDARDDSNGNTYDPCAGKTCGESCTLCAPRDDDCVETQVLKQCDASGSCTAGSATCR